MAKKESVQKRLTKVRPPRVQLTYDVEKGDAIEQKELPFVVGVVADLSGQSEVALPKLRDRKFVNVDRAVIVRINFFHRQHNLLFVELSRAVGQDVTKLKQLKSLLQFP